MKNKPKVSKPKPTEKKKDEKLSRREMIEKSGRYSVAVVSLIFGGGAMVELLGCEKDEATCKDTCAYAFDGVCDDGGIGSVYNACEYGTDCNDCGTRGGYGDYSAYSEYYEYSVYSESYYNYPDVPYYELYPNYDAFGNNE